MLTGYGEMAAAMLAFLLIHALPPLPPVRQKLVNVVGEKKYMILYSLLATAALIWVFSASLRAPYAPLWEWSPWQHMFTQAAMLLACLLGGGGFARSNPFSLGAFWRKDSFDPDNPGLLAITRHPVLWAIVLWGLGHIPPNGDLALLILFGLMGGLTLPGIVMVDRRKRQSLNDFSALTTHTSLIPFAALLTGKASLKHLKNMPWKGLFVGVLAYVGLIALHPLVFGVRPLLP